MTDRGRRLLAGILLGLAALVGGAAVLLTRPQWRHAQPAGEPGAPTPLTGGGLEPFIQAFQSDQGHPGGLVLLVLLAPHQAQASVDGLVGFLGTHPGLPVRVLVVWEAVAPEDRDGPAPAQWKALAERRVIQFWDPGAEVGRSLTRRAGGDPDKQLPIDFAAGYRGGTQWGPVLPFAAFHGPVLEVLANLTAMTPASPAGLPRLRLDAGAPSPVRPSNEPAGK